MAELYFSSHAYVSFGEKELRFSIGRLTNNDTNGYASIGFCADGDRFEDLIDFFEKVVRMLEVHDPKSAMDQMLGPTVVRMQTDRTTRLEISVDCYEIKATIFFVHPLQFKESRLWDIVASVRGTFNESTAYKAKEDLKRLNAECERYKALVICAERMHEINNPSPAPERSPE